jgi:hypothetical protein
VNTNYVRGPKLKLDRAQHHIDNLDAKIIEFLGGNPYALFFKANTKPQTVDIVLSIRKQIPDCFALIVGDALHNLRSALDHLACCVCHCTQNIQFPIAQDKTGFDAMVAEREIYRAGEEAVQIMDSLQPYSCPEGTDLLAIKRLNNLDKHRMLVSIGSGSGALQGVRIEKPSGGSEWYNEWRFSVNPFKNGAVVETIPLYRNIKIGEQLDSRFVTFDILFGPGPCGHEPLGEALKRLAVRVEETIEALRPFA